MFQFLAKSKPKQKWEHNSNSLWLQLLARLSHHQFPFLLWSDVLDSLSRPTQEKTNQADKYY